MHAALMRTTVPMLLVLILGAVSFAGEPPKPQASSAPSIEGTYRFVLRQFPDGGIRAIRVKTHDFMSMQNQ